MRCSRRLDIRFFEGSSARWWAISLRATCGATVPCSTVPRRPVAEPRRWQNFGRVEQPVEPFDNVRDAALAQLSHQRICGPGPPSGPAVLCESGFGDKYGEVVALRTRLSRLPPCLGKMILLRKIIPGGRTGLTRLENPKNRQLATIVIIANALVNADLSGDQAWF